jgi:hypothetical protein
MKLVKGWGINDTELSGPSCTVRDEFGKKTVYPDYAMWYGMLVRSFCEKEAKRTPSTSTSICSELWKLRSEFQKWYFSQETHLDNSGNRLYLDKDILVTGNIEYHPDKCCLVPPYINTILNCGVPKTHGKLMWAKYCPPYKGKPALKKPYQCAITTSEGSTKHVAYYQTEQEAHFRGQLEKLTILSTS